jgi:cyclopropane-fatty-acyl-phospholipid synthase
MPPAKSIIQGLLDLAGIEINGPHPWDLQVYDERFYSRVLREGSLGLGESYMDGWWDARELDQFFARLLKAELEDASVDHRPDDHQPAAEKGGPPHRRTPLRHRQ